MHIKAFNYTLPVSSFYFWGGTLKTQGIYWKVNKQDVLNVGETFNLAGKLTKHRK